MSKALLPIIGTRTGHWLRLLSRHRIPIRYWHRVALSSLVVAAGIPFRRWEALCYGKKISQTDVKPPVFIIGHWRSGTTHLHNLLALDKQFGYITYLQGLFPRSFLSNNVFGRFMSWTMPESRPMDNMKMSVEATQEGEVPMASLNGRSMYTGWYFPRKMEEYFDKWVLFRDMTRPEIESWKRDYLFLLKAATLAADGRPLILKSPANMARVSLLLEMFPRARFIHIHRHPLRVFLSTKKLYTTALPWFQLQPISPEKCQRHFIRFYRDMTLSWLQQKDMIPPENLFELSFENLEEQPIELLGDLYEKFAFPGVEQIRALWKKYLEQKSSYRKNVYQATDEDRHLVREHWGFAAREWGYSL